MRARGGAPIPAGHSPGDAPSFPGVPPYFLGVPFPSLRHSFPGFPLPSPGYPFLVCLYHGYPFLPRGVPFGSTFPGVLASLAGLSRATTTPPKVLGARRSFWSFLHASLVTPLPTRGVLWEDLSPHCSALPGAEEMLVSGCLSPLGTPGEAVRRR